MLTEYVKQAQALCEDEAMQGHRREYRFDDRLHWPHEPRQIVLAHEMALELGSPDVESIACSLWTSDSHLVDDGRITIIGPDFEEASATGAVKLPFGKLVFVVCHGSNEDNAYERFSELNRVKYRLDLSGYMLRVATQEAKEWARVSKRALARGLSLRVIGNETIRALHELPFVEAAEIVYVTESTSAVTQFKSLAHKVTDMQKAMNTMLENLEYDCESCGFSEICDEVEELRMLHRKQQKKKG